MLDLKIYGTDTPTYHLLRNKLIEYLKLASIKYSIEEVSDINTFIKDAVLSVPAIRVNHDALFELKPNGSFNSSLRHTIQSILKMYDYGSLTKMYVPTDFSSTSLNAYNYANGLARILHGVIKIVHIYHPTAKDLHPFIKNDIESEEDYRAQLNNYISTLNQDWMGTFMNEPILEGQFIAGFPAQELTRLSQSENALFIMGTTGNSGALKKNFGSLSLDMVQNCSCPLFLIPPAVTFSIPDEVILLTEDTHDDMNSCIVAGRICNALKVPLKIKMYSSITQDVSINKIQETLQIFYPQLLVTF